MLIALINFLLGKNGGGRRGRVGSGVMPSEWCWRRFLNHPAIEKLAGFYQVNWLNNEADESQMCNEIEHHGMARRQK
ncbi:hypothetical protein [Chromobacterium haemolyticum]|uniref:hypothetical protein n=1 Tax=Chromobacterium haemolyticum TaxID=394935 RepID=UPI00117861F9|nr:hypothetical protein [Chromobacterium haemolyticum]